MAFSIKYGIADNHLDVTQIAYEKCLQNNILFIPSSDEARAEIFTDPLIGTLKSIIIQDENMITTIYDHTQNIYIDLQYNKIHTDTLSKHISSVDLNTPNISYNEIDIETKLRAIQNKLRLDYGSFEEEFPEQVMAVKYLTGNEHVLEIGGNIGRNSLIIGYILNNNNNFVSLESDVDIARQLTHNRDLNNMNFHIENSALSKRKLIQQGWDTICSDVLLDGYKEVNIITLDKLNNKYNIVFDTLVLDCEGAFYYILIDMPEILTNINLIIMENDYWDISKKEYIDNILKNNNFYVDYTRAGGWGPCYNNFFEVWKKKHNI